MIRSMTGYFTKTFNYKTYTLRVSIRSLNHKYLEVNTRGNAVWLGLDSIVREIVKEKIYRGKIDLQIDFEFFDPSKFDIKINYNLFEEIIKMFERFTEKDRKVLNIDSIMKLPGVFYLHYIETPFNEEELSFFKEKLEFSLDRLLDEKEREGRKLKEVVVENIKEVEKIIADIGKISRTQKDVIEERIRKRIDEIYKLKNLNETRFYEELVYYIDKANINEEIDRLKTHIEYVKKVLLSNKKEPLGKKLTFLMQECLREINTIGAKSQIKEISLAVVKAKEHIENIREQAQNIE